MDDSSSQSDPQPAAPKSPASPAEAQAPAEAPVRDEAAAPASSPAPSGAPAQSSAPAQSAAPAPPDQEPPQRGAAAPLTGLRDRIGSLGDRDAARQMKARGNVAPATGDDDDPSGAASQRKAYPPPRTKTQLPAELEQEVEAALGGMSLDAMLSGAADEEELAPETRIQGKVVSVHREDVFVDVGRRHQGIVPLKQFEEPPEPGSELELVVNRFQEEEGFYELLLPGAAADVGDWSEVEEGLVVEATVTGHNKGGLECQIGSLRGFIPASQVDRYRIEDFSTLVGDKLVCVVTECNPERRNLVLSRRAVLEREQAAAQEKLWEELAEGQNREGVVRSLQNFGAFVDLGGVDGLIHISRLSWGRIGHPSEVLEVGQKVRVRVEKLDRAARRVGLSYRDLADNPWESAAGRYTVRSTVRGTVSRVADFGAFVKLEPGIEGLVHISEISHKRVFRVTDVLSEGQEVEALVVSVDLEAQRIGLSLKALEARPESAGDKRKRAEELEVPVTEIPEHKRHKGPLKGGVDRPSGGEQFGLKW